MKRLFIFMVSALAWAGVILAGCNEVEPASVSLESGQKYTLSVKATKGEIATKGFTYEESQDRKDKELESLWEMGDKLNVFTDASLSGQPVVTLETKSVSGDGLTATFEGELDASALENISELWLVYKTPNYGEQKGTLATLTEYSVAKTAITGVDNGKYTIDTDRTKFVNQQAVLMFKFEDENETIVPVQSIEVKYDNNEFTVKVDKTNKGQGEPDEIFIGIPECSSVTLKVTDTDGRQYNYTKTSSNLLKNGYLYPVAVRMHQEPKLGDPYYSDCTYGRNKHAAGASVVGIIVYLGAGAITEESAGYGHGLVMALTDASQSAQWGPTTSSISNDEDKVRAEVKVGAEKALVCYGGLATTNTINSRSDNTKFPAANAVKGYSVKVDEKKCSGWFLPASGQWLSVIYGLCGAAYPDKANGTWWKNGKDLLWGETGFTDKAKVLGADSDYAHVIINNKLQAAAELNTDGSYSAIETGYKNNWVSYWTSTECIVTKDGVTNTTGNAIRMNFGVEDSGETKYSSIKSDSKGKGTQLRVRAFLAF